jgi:uncharacterized protein YbjT (DUF2867 family)
MTRTTALVAGAGGIIGNAVAHELMRSDWRVRALGRRSVEGVPSIQADLRPMPEQPPRHFGK